MATTAGVMSRTAYVSDASSSNPAGTAGVRENQPPHEERGITSGQSAPFAAAVAAMYRTTIALNAAYVIGLTRKSTIGFTSAGETKPTPSGSARSHSVLVIALRPEITP